MDFRTIVKISILVSVICSQSFTMLKAQSNKEVQRIDKIYKKVKQEMKLSIDEDAYLNEDKTLFCNTIEENSNNKTWYNLGVYYFKTQYWYDGIPGFAEEKENPKECLKIVISDGSQGFSDYHSEYLYDNGKLIFARLTNEEEADENTISNELKVYFSNGKPIKKIGKAEHFMSEEAIINSSKTYMTRFLQQLEYYE